jgi:hypothetical protein
MKSNFFFRMNGLSLSHKDQTQVLNKDWHLMATDLLQLHQAT